LFAYPVDDYDCLFRKCRYRFRRKRCLLIHNNVPIEK
jgi:hypothetical protein